jgi:CRP-like cAMP-binding protein
MCCGAEFGNEGNQMIRSEREDGPVTGRFLRGHSDVEFLPEERAVLERAVSEVRRLPARSTLVRHGDALHQSTLLVEGFIRRSIDDRDGQRQTVAVHVPGDFVDLHGYPLKVLDHDVVTLTAVKVAFVRHADLDAITREHPTLTRKLWYATLLDAAMHREWVFRLGRLDAIERIAHFLSETNARLKAIGLSDGHRFRLPITQSDLAEVCGLTTVHVNRVLRQLRHDGLCVFRSSTVEIADPDLLAQRGQFDAGYLHLPRWEEPEAGR